MTSEAKRARRAAYMGSLASRVLDALADGVPASRVELHRSCGSPPWPLFNVVFAGLLRDRLIVRVGRNVAGERAYTLPPPSPPPEEPS